DGRRPSRRRTDHGAGRRDAAAGAARAGHAPRALVRAGRVAAGGPRLRAPAGRRGPRQGLAGHADGAGLGGPPPPGPRPGRRAPAPDGGLEADRLTRAQTPSGAAAEGVVGVRLVERVAGEGEELEVAERAVEAGVAGGLRERVGEAAGLVEGFGVAAAALGLGQRRGRRGGGGAGGGERERRECRRAVAVRPLAGGEAEPVEREEPAAVGGEEGDRLDDVVGLGVVHGVVEADAAPARLDAVGALADGVPVAVAQLPADAEEAVAVRPGARAPRAALDPEEV